MNKDQIAIYLNEHPEFFNEYPELLLKIKSIEENDLPLQPLTTLSLADRILKRAHDDKEHLKSKLEWFLEITRANEKIQEHIFEIERLILTSTNLEQMVQQLKEEITRRFGIHNVVVGLVDGADHFFEDRLQERVLGGLNGTIQFIDQEMVSQWFEDNQEPVLRDEVNGNSKIFTSHSIRWKIKSEALIPIMIRGSVAGVIALGSTKPRHFYEGLRTDFLERLAGKLSIAIDNILLIDRLKIQPLVDKHTGFYNRAYLEMVMPREFELARIKKKNLSCLKMHIDYFHDLPDTWTQELRENLLKEFGQTLGELCRPMDILVRTDSDEFLALLPETDENGMKDFSGKIASAFYSMSMVAEAAKERPSLNMGWATFPADGIESYKDLLHAASREMIIAMREEESSMVRATG